MVRAFSGDGWVKNATVSRVHTSLGFFFERHTRLLCDNYHTPFEKSKTINVRFH